ncbi:MAG: hypothetical protein JWN17_1068 [Frankiales bacterium]|nr:hypothetical protein [Frankiales bacterium]
MTADPRYAELLAHHSLVMALPGVIPMCVLVGVFVFIVVSDRRRGRREEQDGLAQDGGTQDGAAQDGPAQDVLAQGGLAQDVLVRDGSALDGHEHPGQRGRDAAA